MRTITKIAAVAAIAVGASTAAQAQDFSPQVPNPANPAPANPYATNGTPLPYGAVPAAPHVYAGRSVGYDYGYGDGGLVDAPFGVVRGAVGTAGGIVDGTVGPVVNGGRY